MSQLNFQCLCGKVTGTINRVSKSSGLLLKCLCDDCQAYTRYLKREKDVLDANGGTTVYMVSPSMIQYASGFDLVECMSLSNKGLLRWYAGCCNTPLSNTIRSHKTPVTSIISPAIKITEELEDLVGGLKGSVFGKFGYGDLPANTHEKASIGLIAVFIKFLIGNFINGEKWSNPYFDSQTKKPIKKVRELSEEERTGLKSPVIK